MNIDNVVLFSLILFSGRVLKIFLLIPYLSMQQDVHGILKRNFKCLRIVIEPKKQVHASEHND